MKVEIAEANVPSLAAGIALDSTAPRAPSPEDIKPTLLTKSKIVYKHLPEHVSRELSAIWEADRRIPTVESRRRWALARGVGPVRVHNWWYRRRKVAKTLKVSIPPDSYELLVGDPDATRAKYVAEIEQAKRDLEKEEATKDDAKINKRNGKVKKENEEADTEAVFMKETERGDKKSGKRRGGENECAEDETGDGAAQPVLKKAKTPKTMRHTARLPLQAIKPHSRRTRRNRPSTPEWEVPSDDWLCGLSSASTTVSSSMPTRPSLRSSTADAASGRLDASLPLLPREPPPVDPVSFRADEISLPAASSDDPSLFVCHGRRHSDTDDIAASLDGTHATFVCAVCATPRSFDFDDFRSANLDDLETVRRDGITSATLGFSDSSAADMSTDWLDYPGNPFGLLHGSLDHYTDSANVPTDPDQPGDRRLADSTNLSDLAGRSLQPLACSPLHMKDATNHHYGYLDSMSSLVGLAALAPQAIEDKMSVPRVDQSHDLRESSLRTNTYTAIPDHASRLSLHDYKFTLHGALYYDLNTVDYAAIAFRSESYRRPSELETVTPSVRPYVLIDDVAYTHDGFRYGCAPSSVDLYSPALVDALATPRHSDKRDLPMPGEYWRSFCPEPLPGVDAGRPLATPMLVHCIATPTPVRPANAVVQLEAYAGDFADGSTHHFSKGFTQYFAESSTAMQCKRASPAHASRISDHGTTNCTKTSGPAWLLTPAVQELRFGSAKL